MVHSTTLSNLEQVLNWRYATKKFDPAQTISEKNLKEFLDAMRLSLSSFGLLPRKLLVIKDKALTRKNLMRF
ncbi:MAG: nitroreductase family protein [Candidatus Omnitrophica bacterium]|nr:nitroreductase family protein [Candidatus Omnitrophota bacterium]